MRNVYDKEEQSENILTRETAPWSSFECAMREEDRVLFNKMLNECQQKEEYSKALDAKGKYNSTESPFMAYI